MTISEWCRYHAADEESIFVIQHDEAGKVSFCCMCESQFVRRTKSGLGIGRMHAEPEPGGLYDLVKMNKYLLMAPDGAIALCDVPKEVEEL